MITCKNLIPWHVISRKRVLSTFNPFLLNCTNCTTHHKLCCITIRWKKRHICGRQNFPQLLFSSFLISVALTNRLSLVPVFEAPLQIIPLCLSRWLHGRGAILQLSMTLEEHTVHARAHKRPVVAVSIKTGMHKTRWHTGTAAAPCTTVRTSSNSVASVEWWPIVFQLFFILIYAIIALRYPALDYYITLQNPHCISRTLKYAHADR